MMKIDFYYYSIQCPLNETMMQLLNKYKDKLEIHFHDISQESALVKELGMFYPTLTILNGQRRYYKHTEAACDSKATNAIFVLPGFDPLLVGYEKKENGMVPTEHLRDVYNLQGIIKPVILHRGQCIATWTVRKDTIYIKPFQADNKAACERAEKQIRNLTQCSECRYE